MPGEQKRIRGEYRDYAEFAFGARRFLARTDQGREDYFNRLAALLFVTFAFEGFLNHVGAEVCGKLWDRVERFGPRKKAGELCKCLSLTLDPTTRPFETLFTAIERRNALVHPQYAPIHYETTASDSDAMFPPRERDHYADREFVRQAYADLLAVIQLIIKPAGLEHEWPLSLGHSFSDPAD